MPVSGRSGAGILACLSPMAIIPEVDGLNGDGNDRSLSRIPAQPPSPTRKKVMLLPAKLPPVRTGSGLGVPRCLEGRA